MREFNKSNRLNNVAYDIRGPVLDEAMRMEKLGEKILKLNLGNPAPFSLNAPADITNMMIKGLSSAEGYSESKGILVAREAICNYYKRIGISGVSPDNIYTGNGVSELIQLTMQALLNPGDEMLLPSPTYPLWTGSVMLTGATAVHYVCDEQSDWLPDINDIKSKITDKTKGIILINPNNPTGAVYPKELLLQIVKIAEEKGLIVFSDEIYDRLLFDDNVHCPIASLSDTFPCVTFGGLSKSHYVAGYRIGWMMFSGALDKISNYLEGINLLSSMRLCSNVPAQQLVEFALKESATPNPDMLPGGRVYEQCKIIYDAMNGIPGLSAVKPKGAFYIFPKIDTKRFNITSDEKFAFDLLKEKKVLLVHGTGFNYSTPDHFRIVYLANVSLLEKASEEIRDFLTTYKQS